MVMKSICRKAEAAQRAKRTSAEAAQKRRDASNAAYRAVREKFGSRHESESYLSTGRYGVDTAFSNWISGVAA